MWNGILSSRRESQRTHSKLCDLVPQPTAPTTYGGPVPARAVNGQRRSPVPGWVMERAGRLTADSRVELFERLAAAGFLGRRLGHDELVTVKRWLMAEERSSSRGAPTRPSPDVRPTRRPASAGAGVSRYRYVAADGRGLVAGDGRTVGSGPWQHVGEVVDAPAGWCPKAS